MRLFGRKLRKDTRGFSLIELICAVAILGAISTAIGGAMVTSANSYQRGTTEASVQQDSHFTANVIEGLLIDATKNVSFDTTSKVLTIENVDYIHTIGLVGDQLIYTCVDALSGAVVDSGSVLAENVKDFKVNTDDFATSRNAQITIDMERDKSKISTVYNVTSRNNPKSSIPLSPTPLANVNAIDVLTLEPNQQYTTNVGVTASGGAAATFTAHVADNEDPSTSVAWDTSAGTVTVNVGKDETGGADGKFTVVLESSTGENHYITVNVRRVTGVNVSYTSAATGLDVGAVYEFTANVVGTNLPKVNGAVYDTDYMNPYGVIWDFDIPGADYNDYITILEKDEDGTNPRVKIEIKQKITSSLTAIAYAKHDDGTLASGVKTNKSGYFYDNKLGKSMISPSNFTLDADFKRGDDFTQIKERIGMWGEIQGTYGGSWVHRWYRACPATLDANGNVISYTGTWSDWIYFSTGDSPGYSAFRPMHLGKDLLPNESYAIEVRYAYGTGPDGDTGTITWPVADTPESEYKFSFTVPAATITFTSVNVDGSNVNFPVGTVGIPQSQNLTLKRETLYWFNVTAVAGHISKYFNSGNAMIPKLQVYDGSKYVDTNMTEWGWNGGDTGSGQMKLKTPSVPDNSTVKYRLILDWNESWYTENYGKFEHYYNETTGKGIIYFEVKS